MTYFSGRMHFKNRLVSRTCTHRGPIFARGLFTMDEHAIVNVYLYLSLLLRIMFVKVYILTNQLLHLNYKLM